MHNSHIDFQLNKKTEQNTDDNYSTNDNKIIMEKCQIKKTKPLQNLLGSPKHKKNFRCHFDECIFVCVQISTLRTHLFTVHSDFPIHFQIRVLSDKKNIILSLLQNQTRQQLPQFLLQPNQLKLLKTHILLYMLITIQIILCLIIWKIFKFS